MKTLMFKLGITGILIISLLIPIEMVKSLIKERESRRNALILDMGKIWGEPKLLTGLFLSNNNAYFLPEELYIDGDLKAELRSKGIFRIPFYTGYVTIKAVFNEKAIASNNKYISIVISDKDSVEISKFSIGSKDIWFKRTRNKIFDDASSISALLPEDIHGIKNNNEITIKMKISGLDKLHFLQLSKKTKIALKSNWKDPNFTGTLLPTSRKISAQGFEANWELYNSQYAFKSSDAKFDNDASFGVNLFVPVDIYKQTDRSIKYAILFITLTFLTFFLFEILNKLRIHPLQYLLVGFALTLFYLLLLSLSEHINFFISYVTATAATIGLITAYSSKVLKNKMRSIFMGSLLTILYTFLYILLHLEEYTLLLGSIALFIILAIVMYITRNIDWYEISKSINVVSQDKSINNSDIKT